jgi:hypothetical protein
MTDNKINKNKNFFILQRFGLNNFVTVVTEVNRLTQKTALEVLGIIHTCYCNEASYKV